MKTTRNKTLSDEEFREKLTEFNRLIKLPYEDKVEMAHEAIKEALKQFKHPAVSSSFGKDSTVLLHLVLQYNPNIPVIFNNTGVEMRETLEFKERLTKEWNLNLIETKPKMSFWEIVKRYGYPSIRFGGKLKKQLVEKGLTQNKGTPACCKYLKENPAKEAIRKYSIDGLFVGLRWDESYLRRWYIIKTGMMSYVKSWKVWKCYPIAYWSELDIWRYIEENNLPLNAAYEKVDRVGCVVCTAYLGWEEDMKKLYPGLYKKIAKDLGIITHTLDDFESG